MATYKYDLVVIGSGPSGEKGAAQAAYFGKRVAMVEKDYHLGGAAAGTAIPNKTLRETSLALSAIRSRHLYGVDLSLKRETTVQDFLHHERIVKDSERKRVIDSSLNKLEKSPLAQSILGVAMPCVSMPKPDETQN